MVSESGFDRAKMIQPEDQDIDGDAGAVEIRRARYRLVWRPQIHLPSAAALS
jgi:hypothetical protein